METTSQISQTLPASLGGEALDVHPDAKRQRVAASNIIDRVVVDDFTDSPSFSSSSADYDDVTCVLCYDEFSWRDDGDEVGIVCSYNAHFTCRKCACARIKHHLARRTAEGTPLSRDLRRDGTPCPVIGCDTEWPLTPLIKLLPSSSSYAEAYIEDRTKLLLIESLASLTPTTGGPGIASARDVVPALLSEEILRRKLRSEGKVYQCRACGHGPVQHRDCEMLRTHHGQNGVSNACAECGVPPPKKLSEGWEAWDGTFPHADAATASAPSVDPRWRCSTVGCSALLLPGALCSTCGRVDPEEVEIACRATARKHETMLLPALEHIAEASTALLELHSRLHAGQKSFEEDLERQMASAPLPTSAIELVEALEALNIDTLLPPVFTLLRPLLLITNGIPTSSTSDGIDVVVITNGNVLRNATIDLSSVHLRVDLQHARVHRRTSAGDYNDGMCAMDGDAFAAFRAIPRFNALCEGFTSHVSAGSIPSPQRTSMGSDEDSFEAAARGSSSTPARPGSAKKRRSYSSSGSSRRSLSIFDSETPSLSAEQFMTIARMARLLSHLTGEYTSARDVHQNAIEVGMESLIVSFPCSSSGIRRMYRESESAESVTVVKNSLVKDPVVVEWAAQLLAEDPSRMSTNVKFNELERQLNDGALFPSHIRFECTAALCAGLNGGINATLPPRPSDRRRKRDELTRSTFGIALQALQKECYERERKARMRKAARREFRERRMREAIGESSSMRRSTLEESEPDRLEEEHFARFTRVVTQRARGAGRGVMLGYASSEDDGEP